MMERPPIRPVRPPLMDVMSVTQEWERCDGNEAIETRGEDVGREKQAQRQGARGGRGSKAEGRDQRLGAGSRRRCPAERRPSHPKAGPRSEGSSPSRSALSTRPPLRRLNLIRPELQIFATGPPPKPCAAVPISGEHCCLEPPGK